MKTCIFKFICTLAFLLAVPSAHAQSAFETPGEHLIILDADSGEILFEKAARTPMVPASMTKIMTASIVFERVQAGQLSLDDEFIVSENAWRRGGVSSGSSTMFLEPGSSVSVGDLLYGVIVQSGNDACIVLAEGIAGSEASFAILMNAKAKELGLDSANFLNATGWPDEGHVISAYDLARLAVYTLKTYPEFYKIYALENYSWNGITQPNRNPLMLAGFEGADGLKTGYSEASQYGFVGAALREGQRRIFVVNGLSSKALRRSESLRIMTAAFREFKSYKLFDAGDTVGVARVFMGKSPDVALVVKDDIHKGLHLTERKDMKVEIRYKSPVPAPIISGAHIADLVISAPGRDDKTVPLYAKTDVARKSIFGRIVAAALGKIRGE